MSLFSCLGFGRARGAKAPRTPPRRPGLETLEARLVPTVSVLKSFAGMNFNDTASGGEPPDTIVAAGPNHVVELVNTAMRVYDKNGKLLKVAASDGWKQVEGLWRPAKVVMENKQEGSKTTIAFGAREINKGIADKVFTKRELENP